MPSHSVDKLIYMANQIGTFFVSQGADSAPEKIAEHIKKFWDPRMRKAILSYVDAGGRGLSAQAHSAVELLAAENHQKVPAHSTE